MSVVILKACFFHADFKSKQWSDKGNLIFLRNWLEDQEPQGSSASFFVHHSWPVGVIYSKSLQFLTSVTLEPPYQLETLPAHFCLQTAMFLLPFTSYMHVFVHTQTTCFYLQICLGLHTFQPGMWLASAGRTFPRVTCNKSNFSSNLEAVLIFNMQVLF